MNKEKNLPALADLNANIELAFKEDQLNLLLNQQPPDNWLKKHPMAKKEVIGPTGEKIKVPLDYLPIEKVEFLLTRIFQQWRAEVLESKQIFNSVAVTVRLHYLNPVTQEWNFHDGVGAVGMQIDAGKVASDLSAIKSNAVMIGLPAAKSYAIKDAADHLGKLFGRDLNRADTIDFAGAYNVASKDQVEEALMEIKKFTDKQKLIEWANEQTILFKNKEFQEAVNKHSNTLR